MKISKSSLQILNRRIANIKDLIFELLQKQNVHFDEIPTFELLKELSSHSQQTRHLLFIILNAYYPDEAQFRKFEYKISVTPFESIFEEYFLTLDDRILKPVSSFRLIDVSETSVAHYNTGIQRVTRKIFSNKTEGLEGIAWNRTFYIPQNLDSISIKNLTSWKREVLSKDDMKPYIVFMNYKIEVNSITRTLNWVLSNQFLREKLKSFIPPSTKVKVARKIVARFGVKNDQELLIVYGAKFYLPELMFLDERIISIYVVLRKLGLVKIKMLIHDAIPLTFPQYVASPTIAGYVKYTRLALLADEIMCPTLYESRNVGRILKAIDFSFDKEIKVLNLSGEVTDKGRVDILGAKSRNGNLKILILGSLDPRKNQIGMLQAIEDFNKGNYVQISLSIVAGGEWLSDEIHEQIERTRISGIPIKVLKSLSDEMLIEEFLDSDILMFCSFAEGFGLPIAEAGYLGLPVVTSRGGAMEEVASRFCSKFTLVDPKSIQSMSNGLYEIYYNVVQTNQPDSVKRKWSEVSREFLDIMYSEMTESYKLN